MCEDARFIVLLTELDLIGETLQSVVHLKNHVTKLMVGIVKASEPKKITTRAAMEG